MLEVGNTAQYRKVGKVRIDEVHPAPSGTYYTVTFLTGPRTYKDGQQVVWLNDDDKLSD